MFSQTYGRYEMRAKLPTGKGLWPAFWMLPEQDRYGAWAASGEIDIMEAWGSQPYSHQLIKNVSLGKGGHYKVTFDASAD